MKTYEVSGFSPELSLMKKINELVKEVNKLNQEVKGLKNTL